MFQIAVQQITAGGHPLFLALLDGVVVGSFDGADGAQRALAHAHDNGIRLADLRVFTLRNWPGLLTVPSGYGLVITPAAHRSERFSFRDDGGHVSPVRFESERLASLAARTQFEHVRGTGPQR